MSMSTIGIIAEYNPFHTGHEYHIKKSKAMTGADTVVAVMSGNFVQRGEPAVINKYKRAEMALLGGVDLVLEIPTIFACNEAGQFAKGGISILHKLGIIDYISFGSELGNIDILDKLADCLADEKEDFKLAIKEALDKGLSYPRARETALLKIIGEDAAAISFANNILAVEYLKELKLMSSKIQPIAVKREGSGYSDREIRAYPASAMAIRSAMDKTFDISTFEKCMPDEIYDNRNKFNGIIKAELNDFYQLFCQKVVSCSREELQDIYAAGEGLTNKIKDNIRYAKSFQQLTDMTISKRYTRTRLQRLYIQILLGITKKDYKIMSAEGASYTKVLGFNEKGACLLREIRKRECNCVKILTNINKEMEYLDDASKMALNKDILATDIYNLALGFDLYNNSDYVAKPVMFVKK